MDQLLEAKLWSMDQKLDRMLEFQNDLKAHVLEDHRLFYGGEGKSGLVGDVLELKQSNKLYNKVITLIGTVLVGIVGDSIWKALR